MRGSYRKKGFFATSQPPCRPPLASSLKYKLCQEPRTRCFVSHTAARILKNQALPPLTRGRRSCGTVPADVADKSDNLSHLEKAKPEQSNATRSAEADQSLKSARSCPVNGEHLSDPGATCTQTSLCRSRHRLNRSWSQDNIGDIGHRLLRSFQKTPRLLALKSMRAFDAK